MKTLCACKPCGCALIALVVESNGVSSASAREIGEFHLSVSRAMKRKENPLTLVVKEIDGPPTFSCEMCAPKPVETLFR